jgi:hypothetical protein
MNYIQLFLFNEFAYFKKHQLQFITLSHFKINAYKPLTSSIVSILRAKYQQSKDIKLDKNIKKLFFGNNWS